MNRRIEELALNAWPALQTYVYDGWLLRMADGYTKRSNSISPLYPGTCDNLSDKISHCERIYEEAGLPPIFKMTPFVPQALDELLAERGYEVVDPSMVKLLSDITEIAEPWQPAAPVVIDTRLSEAWLATMADLAGLSPHQIAVTRRLLDRPLQKQGFFTLYDDEQPVSCGLIVIEHGYAGLYDIITHPEHRGRGHAEQLIRHMLQWAYANGASQSYLLVVQHNTPANRLYDKLGYKDIYPYWYRVNQSATFY